MKFNFFDNSKLIIFIKHDSVEFYNQKAVLLFRIEFPKELVRHLEIADPKKFESFIADALKVSNLKEGRSIMVLSDELVFQKILPKNSLNSEKNEQEFLSSIPFDLKDLQLKKLIINKWQVYMAVNIHFCREIKKAINDLFPVEMVVPLSLFGEFDPKIPIGEDKIKQILKGSDLIRLGAINV